MDLNKYVANVSDFPIKGIQFKDITPLVADGEAFKYTVNLFKEIAVNVKAEVVVGPDARGFIFGTPVAYSLGIGFIPVRKPGKLPRATISEDYELEYGTNTLSIHQNDIKKGQKVLIIDDLLATGGTIEATTKLIERLGGIVVGIAFVIELEDLKGRDRLKNYNVFSLLKYNEF